MENRFSIVAVTLALMAAGCTSPGTSPSPSFIEQAQAPAVSTAVRRAQSEMNCPAATGQVISREMLQPLSFYTGVPRAEYTIGVTGCGKQANYYVVCPNDGSGSCAAGRSRAEVE
jgi:hypothetical protein